MGNVVGREAELERCRSIIDSSGKGRLVRALRLVGASGMGKTTLAHAAVETARNDGWLVVEVSSFRIHSTFPLFTARRVLQTLMELLGDAAPRYESGLTMDRDRPDEFEEAFLRFVEGVSLDHRLIFLLDDAHWADEASRALIARTASALADRAIVLITTERSDEEPQAALPLVDEAIALGPLNAHAAQSVVRAIYPEASAEIAEAIAKTTRGIAMDLVAVATAARENSAQTMNDVSESARRVVTRYLTLLEPHMRTFLQICALIDEPIDLRLLQQLWTREQLLDLIKAASGRYLIEEENGLRFVHASVLESVLETIPIEIPLRYRIIEAIKNLPTMLLEDYERLAKQSAACGDRELERDTLLKLADAAAYQNLPSLSVSTLERALAIRDADEDEIEPLYARITQLYNNLGRELDAIRACRRGLELAAKARITEGIGSIAASYVVALWNSGNTQRSLDELHHYEEILTSAADQAHLLSAAGTIAMARVDSALYQRTITALAQLGTVQAPISRLRTELVHSIFNLRSGNESAAIEAINRLERMSEEYPFVKGVTHSTHLFHALLYGGAAAIERTIEARELAASEPLYALFRPQVMLARGLTSDVCEFALERLDGARNPLLRRSLINTLATALSLRPEAGDDRTWQCIEEEAWSFESNAQSAQLWPVAAAWSAHIASRYPKRARAILIQLLRDMAQPPDFTMIFYPVAVVYAAKALEEQSFLEAVESGEGIWNDPSPWGQAHLALARGFAAAHLQRQSRDELLRDAAERFSSLAAPFFSIIARSAMGIEQPMKSGRSMQPSNTTRREREIASLVAEGLTNRQIAEKLVLSERTVEGHIANLFAKVNVNSRTQLAAWYLRTASSVA